MGALEPNGSVGDFAVDGLSDFIRPRSIVFLFRHFNSGFERSLELAATFKGTFKSGIKIGDPFPMLVEKYGVPTSYTAQVARYPDDGLYFLMSNDNVLSAKTFTKDTKLIEAQLMNP